MRKTILRWTWPERALKRIKRERETAANEFGRMVRAYYDEGVWDWTGHIGQTNVPEPSCGCKVCQNARFTM